MCIFYNNVYVSRNKRAWSLNGRRYTLHNVTIQLFLIFFIESSGISMKITFREHCMDNEMRVQNFCAYKCSNLITRVNIFSPL